MILTLIVKLFSGMYAKRDWQGVIKIDADDTLEDLHFAIQKAVHFGNDHMYEFRIGRTERSRDREVFDDETGNVYEQTIGGLYPLPDKKSLYYLFDYGDDWFFKIVKAQKTYPEPQPDVSYPRLVQETGDKPEQYPAWDEEE
ncbi:MAG: hypothetical protein IPN53_01680 [Comamonadaceae bacterium]|nr:hypothetical protein [Comamonadaceae bacterium]